MFSWCVFHGLIPSSHGDIVILVNLGCYPEYFSGPKVSVSWTILHIKTSDLIIIALYQKLSGSEKRAIFDIHPKKCLLRGALALRLDSKACIATYRSATKGPCPATALLSPPSPVLYI